MNTRNAGWSRGDRVFLTEQGNPWVRSVNGGEAAESASSKEFSKLLKHVGIKVEKSVGFYALRRTAATVAAESGDVLAVQELLGHAGTRMASAYDCRRRQFPNKPP